MDSWFDYNHMPTELGRDIVQKEFKQLKGRFFQPPRVGHEERENVLTSPVNIIFVYIGASQTTTDGRWSEETDSLLLVVTWVGVQTWCSTPRACLWPSSSGPTTRATPATCLTTTSSLS